MTGLNPPFPWFGGKRRWSKLVWEKFGDPVCYAEPFAGGLAVLLGRPPTLHGKVREVVVDLDGFICNFWRSVRDDPDQVAHYADWPVIHHDLTARHKWLADWHTGNSSRLFADPDYCDPQVAGWWVWGQCNWIGKGWGRGGSDDEKGQRPHIGADIYRQGVLQHQLQHRHEDRGKRPHVGSHIQFPGITQHRHKGGIPGAIQLLSDRLRDVIVLGGHWRQATGNTVLMNVESERHPPAAVFLDPPYLTERRAHCYNTDVGEQPNEVARESYEWAIEHQNDYRIAYCCQTDDFPVPEGWTCVVNSFGGLRIKNRNGKGDCVMFSPGCKGQADLFSDA